MQPSGRRARRALAEAPERSVPGDGAASAASSASSPASGPAGPSASSGPRSAAAQQQSSPQPPFPAQQQTSPQPPSAGRQQGAARSAEALSPAGGRTAFALPPAAADQTPQSRPALPVQAGPQDGEGTGRRRARRPVAGGVAEAEAAGTRQGYAAEGADSVDPQGGWEGGPTDGRRARRAAAEERAAAAMADSEASGTFVAGPEGLVAQPNEPVDATGTATGTAPGIAPSTDTTTSTAPTAPATPATPTAAVPPAAVPPAPTGRRRGRPSPAEEPPDRAPGHVADRTPGRHPEHGPADQFHDPAQAAAQSPTPAPGQPLPPAEDDGGHAAGHSHGRAFSVRTLGQGVPFAQQINDPQHPTPPPGSTPPGGTPPGGTSPGSGRRRKLAAPPQDGARTGAPDAPATDTRRRLGSPQPPAPQPSPAQGQPPQHLLDGGTGRAFAISAPDEGSEGPEPLDGPNGAVEVMDRHLPPMDDELPPEPLDNPRRLLVWPAPDVATQQALSDRGYRPVIVNSREEVDAQIAAYPAALFVDPLTGPITRTALQSLRQAAGAAEVPVLVTAGLGQATREAAYGADPAVLLKALAPRDSELHPPRVLLIEQNDAIAGALTTSLERRGMQVARADADADAVTLAAQMRPNLVVMDLMQVRRRRAGIVDWLRANGLLDHTPLVVYTSADLDPAQLPRLASGETVLFLAVRSTSAEVQSRIVDLLAKIGTS
ncbi:response regulator [Streptomyces celluloflavus]